MKMSGEEEQTNNHEDEDAPPIFNVNNDTSSEEEDALSEGDAEGQPRGTPFVLFRHFVS